MFNLLGGFERLALTALMQAPYRYFVAKSAASHNKPFAPLSQPSDPEENEITTGLSSTRYPDLSLQMKLSFTFDDAIGFSGSHI